MPMRLLLAMLIPAIVANPLQVNDAPKRAETPIADALDWYTTWFVSGQSARDRQTCHGEFRAGLYSFRCDPLAVVVSAKVEDSGRCSVVAMRPGVSQDDGLQVNTLSNLVPPREGSMPRPRDCGELPTAEGPFELSIIFRPREIDNRLTSASRAAALAFIKLGGDDPCVLHFPKVRRGDPFAHVYSECEGTLDNVMEFTIANGKVADFPHWTYDRAHKNLPPGAGRRLGMPDFWSGVSHPNERKETPR
jgi:hypothetical protein